MKSIIQCCNTQEFARVRVGIGEKNPHQDLADYVLGHFQGEEKKQMEDAFVRAAQAVETLITGSLEEAMNRFN